MLGTGWPSSAGGKLVGSLVSLPYALAEAEQNFLIPSREQALIWGDLVPQLILRPRSRAGGTSRPRSSTGWRCTWATPRRCWPKRRSNPERRQAVLDALGQYAMPARVAQVRELLEQGRVKAALEQVTPSELFAIARDLLAPNEPAIRPHRGRDPPRWPPNRRSS